MMKTLSAALALALLAAPIALPVQAGTALAGVHALTPGQDVAIDRRSKRCPKGGETPTTNPACRGHGGGGI